MGKRKTTRARVDPELTRQLSASSASSAAVEAVVVLRAPRSKKAGDDDTDARARALLDRVSEATGLKPHDVNVFTNLCSFVVSAPGPFIEGLIDQAEVTSLTANQRPDNDMLLSAKLSS